MAIRSERRRVRITVTFALVLAVPCLSQAAPADASVALPPASAAASGIVVAPLAEARHAPQVRGIATVLDPQPLLTLAARLQTVHAAFDAATAQARAAAEEAKRIGKLHRDGDNAALRDVQAAAAAASAARAKQVAAMADQSAARGSARAQWGAALASEAERGSRAFDALGNGSAALLAVALPSGSHSPGTHSLRFRNDDGATLVATLIGPSPRADPVVQGPTYFYRVDAAGLRIGQRLSVAVPLRTASDIGVIVPTTAVVWYAGQPWAYIETAAGRFQRRPVAAAERTATGWFQSSGFRAGERVVVRGGELLLSQELLPPPQAKPAGDDDDD